VKGRRQVVRARLRRWDPLVSVITSDIFARRSESRGKAAQRDFLGLLIANRHHHQSGVKTKVGPEFEAR